MPRDTRTGTAYLFCMHQLEKIQEAISTFPKNNDKFLDLLYNKCRMNCDEDDIDFIVNFKQNRDYNNDCFYIGRFDCVNGMTGEGYYQFQPFYI